MTLFGEHVNKVYKEGDNAIAAELESGTVVTFRNGFTDGDTDHNNYITLNVGLSIPDWDQSDEDELQQWVDKLRNNL